MAANPSDGWRKALIPATATIEDAIRSLNQAGVQIALVVSPDDELIGTITDGDIRRGLLRGLRVGCEIDSVVVRNPLVVPPEMHREMVIELMRANKIHHIPVVDERRRLVGLHLWDDMVAPVERGNLMVIMAGGFGTRLHPHTQDCPKPLLPVAGKPMLEHIIDRARAEGFKRFVLAVHHLGHMIEAYFGGGERWQVQIEYVRETRPLGTAGALGLLDPRPEHPFVVTNGDVLTDIRYGDLLDFHARNAAAATMAVRIQEWQYPYGVVHTEGIGIVGFEEKPLRRANVNAGIYALQPAALACLSEDERCDMPTLFEKLRFRGERTVVYPMHEPWLDVGRQSDYDQAERTLGTKRDEEAE